MVRYIYIHGFHLPSNYRRMNEGTNAGMGERHENGSGEMAIFICDEEKGRDVLVR